MKLPIPILTTDKVFVECTLKHPTTEIIAATKEKIEDGKFFGGMLLFVSGCIELLTDTNGDIIEDREKIKNYCRFMNNVTAEHMATEIMLMYDGDDGMEGYFQCPRCGKEQIAELKDGNDTRDHIRDLEVNYMENFNNSFSIDFTRPVEITIKGIKETISSVTFRYPTLEDYIEAEAMHGIKNSIKLQLAVYRKCMIEVDGAKVDKQWTNNFGDLLLKKSDIRDINKISDNILKYGFQRKIKKTCRKCNKEWDEEITTNNFFVSGLQSN